MADTCVQLSNAVGRGCHIDACNQFESTLVSMTATTMGKV